MRKRVRSVLTGLLVGCCVAAGIALPGRVQAIASGPGGPASAAAAQESFLQPVWTWIQEAARATGAFFASIYTSVHDFFASGEALRLLQSATDGINGFATRLFLPISSPIAPLLSRLLPGATVTPELIALWIFWIIVALMLILIILAVRPRRAGHRLPKVTPRTPGQEENTIQFGMVEEGPQPSPVPTPAQTAHMHEPQAEPVSHGPAAVQPAAPEQPSPGRAEPRSIPEISFEPLGLFGQAPAGAPAAHEMAQEPGINAGPAVPPLLEPFELQAQMPESEAPEQIRPQAISESRLGTPAEALLLVPEEVPPTPEVAALETPELTLTPLGEQAPAELQPSALEPVKPAFEELSQVQIPVPETTEAVVQPLPAEEAAPPEMPTPSEPSPIEEPGLTEGISVATNEGVAAPEEAPPTAPEAPGIATASEAEAAPAETIPAVPAAADLLTRLLDEEESFPQVVASTAPAAPSMPSAPTPQPSVFSGDVDLDELLHDGVVTDADALAQLFHGGYRSRISKLAVSAKDLQNVPEEMRQAIKVTVVALSPIEMSIARDLAMRLDAPGFVGEALLVAKKMGYENYLTTYRNISKNYKDVSIVETTSLKVPDVASESGGELISFN